MAFITQEMHVRRDEDGTVWVSVDSIEALALQLSEDFGLMQAYQTAAQLALNARRLASEAQ